MGDDLRNQSNYEYKKLRNLETDYGGKAPWSRGKQPRPTAKVPKGKLSVKGSEVL